MATRRLLHLAPIVALLAAACALSLLSRTRSQFGPNSNYWLFLLEPAIVIGGGLAALFALQSQPRRAAGVLGVGFYTLLMGVAFLTIFPIWLPEDDTILGSAFVGGLMVGAGVGLAVAAARIVSGRQEDTVAGVALGSGVGAFILATFGGVVAFPIPARPQFYVAGLAAGYTVWTVRHVWYRVRRPLLIAGGGIALSVGLLVVRGPGDWATSDSTTLKLYSFPILLVGVAICLGILTLSQSALPELDASAGMRPSTVRYAKIYRSPDGLTEVPAAGFAGRLAAVVVDWLVCLLILGIVDPLIAVTSLVIGRGADPLPYTLLAAAILAYFTLMYRRGATIGMRLAGIRLVGAATGGPPGIGRSLARAAFALGAFGGVIAAPAYMGLVYMFGDTDEAARGLAIDSLLAIFAISLAGRLWMLVDVDGRTAFDRLLGIAVLRNPPRTMPTSGTAGA